MSSFSKNKTKSLFAPWKLGLTKWFYYLFCANVFGSDWYLFQLIDFLKPDYNCWSNFALSWVDKVTTGIQSFLSVIVNLPLPVELVMTQVDDHVKKRLTSQLINGISRVLQKLLKYSNGTIILTSFVLPPAGVLPITFTLDLNDSEFAKLSFGSSL